MGLYFGAREETAEGVRFVRYQYLRIQKSRIAGKTVFALERYLAMEPIEKGADKPLYVPPDVVALAFLDDVQGELVLEVLVSNGRLIHAKVDGVELPELVKPEVNARFSPEDYSGGFGAWISFADGTFRSARFMLVSGIE